MKKLLALTLLFLAGLAQAQTFNQIQFGGDLAPYPISTWNSQKVASLGLSGLVFATAYGSCTWDATHDVGPCINAAIAAAVAGGGGTVVFPCGTYGIATAVQAGQTWTSGVTTKGCGVGIPAGETGQTGFLAGTKFSVLPAFTSTGGQTAATPVFNILGPNSLTSPALYAVDQDGWVVECNNIANIGIEIVGVTFSKFRLGGSECITNNILVTLFVNSPTPGNQNNEFWLYSRSTSNTNAPVGILFDAPATSGFNTSYNIMRFLYAWFNLGDGIVLANTDNTVIDTVRTFPQGGVANQTATGRTFSCVNSNDTLSNGYTTTQNCRMVRVLHYGGQGFYVGGLQKGATLVASGGAAMSLAPIGPLTVTSPAPGAGNGKQSISFASIQNIGVSSQQTVDPGMSLNCTNPAGSTGVFPNAVMTSVTLPTTVNLFSPIAVNMHTGTNTCTFSWGVTDVAAAPTGGGNYTSYVGFFSAIPTYLTGGGHFGQQVTASIDNCTPSCGAGASGNILNVTAIIGGDPLFIGETIIAGASAATITDQTTGTPGSTGRYTISNSQTVASTTISFSACTTVPGWCMASAPKIIAGDPNALTPQGNNQSGIQTTQSGHLIPMTDVIIPIQGTAANGDFFTLTVPTPTKWVNVEGGDAGNTSPAPSFEHGATGYYQYMGPNAQFFVPFNYPTQIPTYYGQPSIALPALTLGLNSAQILHAPSWGLNGLGLAGANYTMNDDTASGTIADEALFSLGTISLTATNAATTVTNLETFYAPAPTASTNVTATNLYGIKTQGIKVVTNPINANAGATITGTQSYTGGTVTLGGAGNLVKVSGEYASTGTVPTLGSGTGACATTSTQVGGTQAGSFLCTGTAGASTIVLTFPTATPGGWACSASDVTSGVVWAQVIPVATTSCKLTGTIATTSDKVVFQATGF